MIFTRVAVATALVALAAAIASPSAWAVTCKSGVECHAYAGQYDLSASRYGIDGYVSSSASTGLPANEGIVYWVGLDQAPSAADWAQAGQYQGTLWNFLHGSGGSLTTVRQYWENNEPCNYHGGDLGVPPTSNYAYYVTRTTSTTFMCSIYGTAIYNYVGYVRVGSFTNPPSATVYLPTGYNTIPDAETEKVTYSGVEPGIHPAYFGLDNSHQVSAGYSLHLLTSSTWQSWTVANTGQAPSKHNDSPPFYHGLGGSSDYSQFYASDS